MPDLHFIMQIRCRFNAHFSKRFIGIQKYLMINFVFNKCQRLLEVKVFISPWLKHVSQNRGILKVYTIYPNLKKNQGVLFIQEKV